MIQSKFEILRHFSPDPSENYIKHHSIVLEPLLLLSIAKWWSILKRGKGLVRIDVQHFFVFAHASSNRARKDEGGRSSRFPSSASYLSVDSRIQMIFTAVSPALDNSDTSPLSKSVWSKDKSRS